MVTIIIIGSIVWIWLKYEMENAPLLDEQTGDLQYKEWITFLGYKIKRRKK